MSVTTQQLAKQAIDAFSAWVNAMQAEQDNKLYRADWADEYGETVRKIDACKILCRSRSYLDKLIAEGQVKVNADGRVLVRSLQKFAEQSPAEKRHRRRMETRREA